MLQLHGELHNENIDISTTPVYKRIQCEERIQLSMLGNMLNKAIKAMTHIACHNACFHYNARFTSRHSLMVCFVLSHDGEKSF